MSQIAMAKAGWFARHTTEFKILLVAALFAILIRTFLVAIQFWIPDERYILAAGGGGLLTMFLVRKPWSQTEWSRSRWWMIWSLLGGMIGAEIGAFTGVGAYVLRLYLWGQL